MLSISHVTTGAFIASKINNPLIAFPVILVLHYLQDWIPHWDVGTGLSTGKRKKTDAFFFELIELVLAFGLVYLFWDLHTPGFYWYLYLAGTVSLIPDFLEAPRNFLGVEPFFLKPLNAFHGFFHHSTANIVIGLTPQLILLLTIYLLK